MADIVASVLIAIGAVVMGVSIARAGKAGKALSSFGRMPAPGVARLLLVHRVLMAVFLLGYLAVIAILLRHLPISGNFLVGIIFLLGALFVLLGLLVQEQLLGVAAAGYAEALDKSEALERNGCRLAEVNESLRREMAQRQLTQQKIQALRDELTQTEKLKAVGQLAGGVAHDFNNMLGAILGYAELLRSALAEKDPKLHHHADAIVRAATRSADLTTKLLTFARKGSIQNVPFHLHDAIGETLGLLRHTMHNLVEIHTDPRAEQDTIIGDRAQIQNALMNLVLNARDAMPEGGDIHIESAQVRVADTEQTRAQGMAPGEYIELKVRDSGVGIAPSVREHIFEPFYTTKPVGKGTGLGLASVYGVIKSHRGDISVSSTPGKGTCFTLLFPLAIDKECGERVASSGADTGALSADLAGARIVVVDDEVAFRTMLAALLRRAGYEVVAFGEGREALAYLTKAHEQVRAVILDMVMPEMSGRECCESLRRFAPRMPVVLSSGNYTEDEVEDMLKHDLTYFIAKPFTTQQIQSVVHEAVTPRSP